MSKKLFCEHCNKKVKFNRKWEKDSNYTHAQNLYCSECGLYVKTAYCMDTQSYNILFKEVE